MIKIKQMMWFLRPGPINLPTNIYYPQMKNLRLCNWCQNILPSIALSLFRDKSNKK